MQWSLSNSSKSLLNHYWTILSWLVRSIHPNNLKVNLDHHPKSVGKIIEITSQVRFAFPPVDDHEKTRFRMISFHVVLPKINASICNSSYSFIHYRNAVDTSETKLVWSVTSIRLYFSAVHQHASYIKLILVGGFNPSEKYSQWEGLSHILWKK